MNRRKRIPLIVLIAISFLFIVLFYHKILLAPNNYLFSSSGDALKNYFTYASQVKGNSGFNSQIMNYPYGENFLYLDCQPAIAIIVRTLSVLYPSLSDYSIGILNFLIILSFVLSSLFIYLILNEFKVNYFISVSGAFSVAVLAPQIFRITGHLALTYSFFIPLTWYLFIRFFNKKKKIKWSVILFFNNLFWYFVHPYLGMIVVSFLLLFYFFDFLFFERKKYFKINQWLYISLQSFLPLIIFSLFLSLSDTHVGRINDRFGYLIYTADFNTIFLPYYAPLRPVFDKLLHLKSQNWEGWAYIGIGSSFTILIFLLNRILKYFNKRIIVDDRLLLINNQFVVSLLSAICLLLLSMGYPFRIKMEFLLNWIPIIKNFRGIGRFSWIFYYVITISCLYYVHLIYENSKRKKIILFVVLMLPASYLFEGISYHQDISNKIIQSQNYFDKTKLPKSLSDALQYADRNIYQAIIPLPFYHIGSEYYGKTATDKIYKLSMVTGYHSGIPILGNYSTKTSLPESRKIIQLLSPGFYQKNIEKDIVSNKPFLIIYSNEYLSEPELEIYKKSKLIFSNNDYSLCSITKDLLFENTASDEIQDFKKIRNQLSDSKGFMIDSKDSNSIILYDSFEEFPEDICFRGLGSLKSEIKDYYLLKQMDPAIFKRNVEYLLSFWIYNGGDNDGMNSLISKVIVQTVDKTNKIEWVGFTHPANSLFIDDVWTLIELNFTIINDSQKVLVLLQVDDFIKRTFIIDDLLIREKSTQVYKTISEENDQIFELFKNNHKIKYPCD